MDLLLTHRLAITRTRANYDDYLGRSTLRGRRGRVQGQARSTRVVDSQIGCNQLCDAACVVDSLIGYSQFCDGRLDHTLPYVHNVKMKKTCILFQGALGGIAPNV